MVRVKGSSIIACMNSEKSASGITCDSKIYGNYFHKLIFVQLIKIFSPFLRNAHYQLHCNLRGRAIAQDVNVDLSLRMPGFSPRPVHVGCGLAEVALGQVSVRVLRHSLLFRLCSILIHPSQTLSIRSNCQRV